MVYLTPLFWLESVILKIKIYEPATPQETKARQNLNSPNAQYLFMKCLVF